MTAVLLSLGQIESIRRDARRAALQEAITKLEVACETGENEDFLGMRCAIEFLRDLVGEKT